MFAKLPNPKKKFLSARQKALLAFLATAAGLTITNHVQAANLQTALLRFNRMQTNTANTTILVALKPSGSTDDKVRVVLDPNSYTIDSSAPAILTSTVNVLTESLVNTGICAQTIPLTAGAAAAVSNSTIDFSMSSTALSANTIYCFYITKGVGTANTTATSSLQNRVELYNGVTLNETSRVGTATISSDQVTITAVVPSIFTFTLGATSDSFVAELSNTRITSTAGVTVTVATNASAGWEAWLKSANGALLSAATSGTIPTTGTINDVPATLSNGTSAYVVAVTTGTGLATQKADAEYDSNAGGGTVNSAALERIAYDTAATGSDSFIIYGRATVSGTQAAAADYTDTWTVVGAGQF